MRQEKGLYIVFFALLLFVLLGLVALALGLGYIGTNKTRLQNGVNLAALAALEKFAGLPQSDSYLVRADKARDRASEIFAANILPGVEHPLGELGHHGAAGPGGTITLGNWYQKKPNPVDDPCTGSYPCFVANPDPSGSVPNNQPMNAVRIEAHNQSNNPLLFRLGRFLGKDSFILSSSATATVVPRCTAYLMDVSDSSYFETHPTLPIGSSQVNSCITPGSVPPACPDPSCLPGCLAGEPACYGGCNPYKTANLSVTPINFGLGAYRYSPQYTPTHLECAASTNYDLGNQLSRQTVYWCNSPHIGAPDGARPGVPPSSGIFRHYQSDYELEDSPLPGGGVGQIWVDKLYVAGATAADPVYDGPQPFTRNFLAFNAGLRQVQSTTVGGDLSYIMAFTGQPRSSVPATGLTSDLGFLIQLTNLDNRGKRDWQGVPVTTEIHPNFIDFGWAPFPGEGFDSTSAIGNAVYFAAERLHSSCPSQSRKTILLASDGQANTHFGAIPEPQGLNGYNNYVAAVNQLLNTSIPVLGGGPNKPPILQMLKEYEISFSMIMDGFHIAPNFLNIASGECGAASTWTPGSGFGNDDPKCYFSFQEGYAHGFGGKRSPSPLFDWESYDPSGTPTDPATAYDNAGRIPGWSFGDPIGVWSDVALETGGYFCPLLAVAPVGQYVDFYGDRGGAACDAPCPGGVNCSPCVLRSAARNPNPGQNIQKFAPQYTRKSEQAAQCARQAVGLNPFTLVEKDN
ncbi:MAG: hypothetical protein J0M12_00485 [Deltaproteobacteria bacterium]|nr:hypothetical protein [Deltaproteobacteria bacterium]